MFKERNGLGRYGSSPRATDRFCICGGSYETRKIVSSSNLSSLPRNSYLVTTSTVLYYTVLLSVSCLKIMRSSVSLVLSQVWLLSEENERPGEGALFTTTSHFIRSFELVSLRLATFYYARYSDNKCRADPSAQQGTINRASRMCSRTASPSSAGPSGVAAAQRCRVGKR